ncbi:hypothetical protein [Neglectibacter timonensis]|uniref:hypothetical protein n=1 Tax=Neglectibacter timonensis TaxID=1776382 RepID=UPI00248D7B1B|nr:hypothetical protein [Neglectibacter timonensis]
MAKYKCGDRVRIVSTPRLARWNGIMNKWLGETMTITSVSVNSKGEIFYRMAEDRGDFYGCGWCWYEDMISGLAESDREYTVELRFDGMITTATLKRGGRDVKTAEARCNPKDTYSRAEGARVAVERLFAKKRKEDKPEESKPKVGDKFWVIGNQLSGKFRHYFRIGEIVTLVTPEASYTGACVFKNIRGMEHHVRMEDVRPYKESAK